PDPDIDPVAPEVVGQPPPEGIVTDLADEAARAPGGGGEGGDVGRAASPAPEGARRGVGGRGDRAGQPHDDVLQQVADRAQHVRVPSHGASFAPERAARRSAGTAGAQAFGWGTRTIGQGAWWLRCWLTDPSSSPTKPPCPRDPTTNRSACSAASSSTS